MGSFPPARELLPVRWVNASAAVRVRRARASGRAFPPPRRGPHRRRMSDKFISIEGIAKRYPGPGGATTTVFEDLWLSMPRGEFTCVIGHCGCGKTTILNILAGL